jgi:hypothetical protein
MPPFFTAIFLVGLLFGSMHFQTGNLSEKLALICGLMVWHTPQFSPPNKINIASFSRFKVSNCA